ncbi:hypothetical protein [Actinoallomurus sp. NPDC052274]
MDSNLFPRRRSYELRTQIRQVTPKVRRVRRGVEWAPVVIVRATVSVT